MLFFFSFIRCLYFFLKLLVTYFIYFDWAIRYFVDLDIISVNLDFQSKNIIQYLASYDLDGDGVDELITGWSNGKIDARNSKTGEIIFKENFSHGIAGIIAGDYRRAGRNQLIIISQTGEGGSLKRYDLQIVSGRKKSVSVYV